jgi:hypothetical protein
MKLMARTGILAILVLIGVLHAGCKSKPALVDYSDEHGYSLSVFEYTESQFVTTTSQRRAYFYNLSIPYEQALESMKAELGHLTLDSEDNEMVFWREPNPDPKFFSVKVSVSRGHLSEVDTSVPITNDKCVVVIFLQRARDK